MNLEGPKRPIDRNVSLPSDRLAICATEVVVRPLLCSPVVLHNAVQSFRGAFTVLELQAMAEWAELRCFQIVCHHAVFRMVLEGRK
jgi:hypothetical protein